MGTKSVRLRSERDQKLREIFDFVGVKSDYEAEFSEAMREFIDEMHKKLIVDKFSPTPQKPESEREQVTEKLQCVNRIIHNDRYWCVHKPPRMVELSTLQICKVCKDRNSGVKAETPFQRPSLPLTPAEKLWQQCPVDLRPLLFFENDNGFVKLTPRARLDPDRYNKVSRWVLSCKGEFFSLGQDSHFRIFNKNIERQPSKSQRS